MRQAVIDALAHDLRADRVALAAGCLCARHCRRAASGRPVSLFPPFAQIDNFGEARVGVGELTLVNDQARRGLPAFHRVEDLIERHDDVIESRRDKVAAPDRRSSSCPGSAIDPIAQPGADFFDPYASAPGPPGRCRDHHRAVAIAHARAAGQKRITVAHIRKGVNRDRGDVQFAAKRALIQRLNVFEPMLEAIAAQIDLVFRHRVKHEGVIRIGRMAEGENIRSAAWPHASPSGRRIAQRARSRA